jgi:3-deoxy-7-phosphoheptulonate synthase
MIIKLKPDITSEDRNRLVHIIQESGADYSDQDAINQSEIYINEAYTGINIGLFYHMPGVESIIEGEPIYNLVSRNYKKSDTIIQLDDLYIGGDNYPVMIAGPCAVENEDQIRETAQLVSSLGVRIMRGGAYKPRTSPYSFTGLEERGLELLGKVKKETGLFIITEVLDTADVEVVAAYSDILQIGSRNMQNYKLLKAVGRIRKPVLLKRGMSARLDEFLGSAEYIMKGGNEQVILCERGIRTFVEYSRNTLDLNVVPVVKNLSHLPIIVDPSHGTGRRDLIMPMSLAALAAGADGLMVEVHPHPDNSWSDPEQALSPEQFSLLMEKFTHFLEWLNKNVSVTTAP